MNYYSSFPLSSENCLSNRAINYGDGLFETMLVRNKKIALWDLHFQRLDESLQRLNMESIAKELLYSKIYSLLNDNHTYIAKLAVFRGGSKRGYASESRKAQFFITVNRFNRVLVNNCLTKSTVLLAKQKKLAGLKHLNRLEQVLAAQELNGSDYSDAIMLDHKQHVIETISKNIVLIKGSKLYTPKLNKCGVYGVALRWLQAQGYELKWKKIEFNSMQKYDGMMVCNSVQGFTSITHIDKKITYKKKIKVTDKIKKQWKEYTK